MKKDIHPPYFKTSITCTTCHFNLQTGSTIKTPITVDTCSQCHPFLTKSKDYLSKRGQVEIFKSRFQKTQKLQKQQRKQSMLKK